MGPQEDSHVELDKRLVLNAKSASYQEDLALAIQSALTDARPELSEEDSDVEMQRFLEEEFPTPGLQLNN